MILFMAACEAMRQNAYLIKVCYHASQDNFMKDYNIKSSNSINNFPAAASVLSTAEGARNPAVLHHFHPIVLLFARNFVIL